jgi:hypothetical protein
MDGGDDKEGVWNVDSEDKSVSAVNLIQKMGTVKPVKLRQTIGMVMWSVWVVLYHHVNVY